MAQAVCKIDGTSGSEGSFLFLRQRSNPEQEKTSVFRKCEIQRKIAERFVQFPKCRRKEDAKSSQIPSLVEHRAVHHRLERSDDNADLSLRLDLAFSKP